MSFVIADPEVMASVGVQLAGLGATLEGAHAAAASALAVVPAAADEVSAAIAHAFTGFGHEYQAMASQAAAFHQAFSKNLTANAAAYADTEFLQDAILGTLHYIPIALAYWATNDPKQLLIWLIESPLFLLLLPIEIPAYLLLGILFPANGG